MNPRRNRHLAVLVAGGLLALPLAASAEDPVGHERSTGPASGVADALQQGGVRRGFDAVIQRPVELVQLAAGVVAFVPAYPVAWLFGAGDEVVELCISQPYDRVLRKPLGEL